MKNQKGYVIHTASTRYQPKPDEILITTAPNDVYKNENKESVLPVFTANGFQNGFSEYTTELPKNYHISTNQPCYGLQFLKANVPGPTFLQYPSTKVLLETLSTGRFKVVGISSYTWTLPWALEFSKFVKENFGIVECWLGSYAVMTEEPLMKERFDRLFWGYSESTLREAVGLESLSVKELCHPDLTTRSNWLNTRRLIGHTIFQRGCSNRCIYCADPVFTPGGEPCISMNSLNRIFDHYQDKGMGSVYISNQDTRPFSHNGKLVINEIYKRGMRFGMMTSFMALTAKGKEGIVELVDKGLTFLLVALESLNDLTLDNTNRKTNRKLMEDTLQLLSDLKVTVTSTYIICFEEDTPDSIIESQKAILDLGVSFCLFNIYMPLPGTPVYRKFRERNLITDWDWTHWTGNHLVWKHPCISPDEARDLLKTLRRRTNHPEYNEFNRQEWESRSSCPVYEY